MGLIECYKVGWWLKAEDRNDICPNIIKIPSKLDIGYKTIMYKLLSVKVLRPDAASLASLLCVCSLQIGLLFGQFEGSGLMMKQLTLEDDEEAVAQSVSGIFKK
jgi:hypothetical protein